MYSTLLAIVFTAPHVASIVYNLLMLGADLLVLRWIARRHASIAVASALAGSPPQSGDTLPSGAAWRLCLQAVLRVAAAGMVFALLLGGSPFGTVRLLAYGMFLHGPLTLLGLGALMWRPSNTQTAFVRNQPIHDPPGDDCPADPPVESAPGGAAALDKTPDPAWMARRQTSRRWLSAICWAGAVALAAVAVDAFLIEPQWLELTRVEIASPKLTRAYRIVLITDLQVDRVTDYERRALLLAKEQNADLILLGGDYTQVAWKDFEAIAHQLNELLREVDLTAPLGVLAVRGNVDVFDWEQSFRELPITLVPHTRSFQLDQLRVTCLGLYDSYRTDLHIPNPEPQRFHIVLGHCPNFALGNVEADLLLAGHTHGGQVRLPLLGTVFPNAAVPRAWAAGLTSLPSGAKLYVSRGVGMERGDSPRMRFLCRPELTVIDLVPSAQSSNAPRGAAQDAAFTRQPNEPPSPPANSAARNADAMYDSPNAYDRSQSLASAQGKDDLPPKFARLIPLHTPLGKPKPGEWLWSHPEPGQTYRQYVASRPVRPTPERRTIYVQPLGEFSAAQQRIVDLTVEFLGIFFALPVRKLQPLSLDVIPAKARRVHPTWGDHQILTGYVLYEVLKPRMPKDACALIGLTTSDLWPGEGWNFVFGEASLRDRVGVWSLYRNGEPEKGDDQFRLCLLRTIKTAAHELCHMFSMAHCTAFECLMCGSNHRAEADRRPLALCPHCLAKLCYATGADPEKRYEKLIDFCRRQGLKPQQEFYQKLLARLREAH